MGEKEEKENDSGIEEIEKLIDPQNPVEPGIAKKAIEMYEIPISEIEEISDEKKSIKIKKSDGFLIKITKASLLDKEEKPTKTVNDESPLPDPSKIEIEPLTPEQRRKEEQKLTKLRERAKQVGEILQLLVNEQSWIEGQENWEASPELRERHEQLTKLREKYYTDDPGVQKLVEINLYTAKIRALAEKIREARVSSISLSKKELTQENKLYDEGVKLERLFPLTEEEAKGKAHILYERFGKRVFGFIEEPGKRVEGKNEANAAIEMTFRHLYKEIKEYQKNAVSRIKKEATGLTTTLLMIARGNQTRGKIVGYLPGFEERSEVYFLVEFDGQFIRPLEATGRLQRFFTELVTEEIYITWHSLMETIAYPEKPAELCLPTRLSEKKFKAALRFLRILKAAVMYELKTEKNY